MNKLVFEKTNIGRVEVKNRFIRSATVSGVGTIDGYVTEEVLNKYRDFSEGQVGLIITGTVGVMEDDPFAPRTLRIHDDSYIEGLKNLTDMVHKDNSKIIAQIGHNGALIFSKPKNQPIGPSEVKDSASGIIAKEMTKNDIENIVEAFGQAAVRSKKAGFDGVQIHAAHGFLLNKFLTPFYNRRNDEYGGSVENRTRIIVKILNNIKTKCGKEFSVFLKINSSDFLEDKKGFTFEDCKEACEIFSEAGYDALEISGGLVGEKYGPARTKIHTKEQEAYHRELAEIIAEEISTPIILVGGIKSLEVAEEILKETKIEAISLSRPLIREPKLVKRWIEGDTQKATCISCNKCFTTEGVVCIFNK